MSCRYVGRNPRPSVLNTTDRYLLKTPLVYTVNKVMVVIASLVNDTCAYDWTDCQNLIAIPSLGKILWFVKVWIN